MPTLYTGNCKECKKTYTGHGAEYCSRKCAINGSVRGIKRHFSGIKRTPFTDKWRKEHSERMMGSGNPRYGVKCSDETKRKISKSNSNPSEETRKKLSIAASKRIMSEESNKKRSETLKGRIISKETREKIGKAQIGKIISKETRSKMSESGKKKKISQEHRKKISISNSGSKNGRWLGGVTPIYESIRSCIKYKEWHLSVFSRDNYTCTECGDRVGGNLNAHHEKSFSSIIKNEKITKLEDISIESELWDINNGVTLCIPCHKKKGMHIKREKK